MADRSKVPVSRIDGLDEKLKEVSGFDFEGTKAEFDAAVAAGTITDDSVSLITDDVSGDNVATKAELQAVDRSKADTNLGNVPSNYDYVVESQVNSDGSWYRKYKSGWLEQGGVTPALEIPLNPTSGVATVTFLKPFSKLYSCHVSPSSWASSVVMDFGDPLIAKASNNIWARSIANVAITVDKGVQAIWYACGQGA